MKPCHLLGGGASVDFGGGAGRETFAAATALAGGGASAFALLGLHWVRAADATARAARLQPKAKVRGGQRRLPVAPAGSVAATALAKGEGSGASFACLASGQGR